MDKWEKEMIERNRKNALDIEQNNNEILKIPSYLTDEEKKAYEKIAGSLKDSIKYRLSHSDTELIWQYCQIKIMRDRAWREYNKNPERYIRIVTGICLLVEMFCGIISKLISILELKLKRIKEKI